MVDASFRWRVSGLPVRNSNPPALAGGCLVLTTSTLNFMVTFSVHMPTDQRQNIIFPNLLFSNLIFWKNDISREDMKIDLFGSK